MTATRMGFGELPCPRCGEETSISLDLTDLSTFTCTACEEQFDLAAVVTLVRRWQAVLAWLDTTPMRGDAT